MLSSLFSAALFGLEAIPVTVEVDVTFGLPALVLVGLPDTSVRESRDRVRAAIRNSGFDFPLQRVTVNLAPADVRKAGTAFDLPIALGVLAATGVVHSPTIVDTLIVGELSLDGSMLPTRGVLPVAALARRRGFRRMVLPAANVREAAVVSDLHLLPADSLSEAVRVLNDPACARAVDAGSRLAGGGDPIETRKVSVLQAFIREASRFARGRRPSSTLIFSTSISHQHQGRSSRIPFSRITRRVSPWLSSFSSSRKRIGSARPSACGQSEPISTRSTPIRSASARTSSS